MASLASANRVGISIAPETVAGTLQPLFYDTSVKQRFTGESIGYNLSNVSSTEIRADRMTSSLVQVSGEVSGDIQLEMSAKSYDPLLESVMGSTYTTPTAPYAVADFVAASTSTATSATTAFDVSNLTLGQWVKLSGGTVEDVNNKYVQLSTTIAATTALLTFEGAPLTVATVDSITVTESSVLKNGVEDHSFSIVKTFHDLDTVAYHSFAGCRASALNLDFTTGSILTGSVSFIGMDATSSTTPPTGTLGNESDASTTEVFDSVGSISQITLDGLPSTANFSSLSLTIDGNLRGASAIGSKSFIDILQGAYSISGSISVYFSDLTEYSRYVDGTSFSLSFVAGDDAGNAYVFTMGNLKYETGTVNGSSLDSDVMLDASYKALLDASSSTMIQIDRFVV